MHQYDGNHNYIIQDATMNEIKKKLFYCGVHMKLKMHFDEHVGKSRPSFLLSTKQSLFHISFVFIFFSLAFCYRSCNRLEMKRKRVSANSVKCIPQPKIENTKQNYAGRYVLRTFIMVTGEYPEP